MASDLRMFLIGMPGEGKTTFISSIPKALILDYENGACGIPFARAVRVHIDNPEKHHQVMKKLIADGKAKTAPFKHIVIDSIDQCVDMLGEELGTEKKVEHFSEYGDKGAGWGLLRNRFWMDVEALQSAGYSWTIIGHMTEKTIRVNKQDITVQRPCIYDSINKLVYRNCDVFARMSSITKVERPDVEKIINGRPVNVPGPETRTTTYYFDAAKTPSNYSGGKVRGVPSFKTRLILPDKDGWDIVNAEYNTAVAKEKKRISELSGQR